jgi:hypothetical protein
MDSNGPRSLVLVEGLSDKAAVEAVARRLGHDLASEGVSIVSMGGATNISRFLEHHVGDRQTVIMGLYDEAEERYVRRAMERTGRGIDLTRADLEELGFFVCITDLEDELIRSLGVDKVSNLVDSEGESSGFLVMQNQPYWRDRALRDQLHRFIGIRSGRKIRYGTLLAEALDLDRLPRPLDLLMRKLFEKG